MRCKVFLQQNGDCKESSNGSVVKARIKPEFTKEEFLRKLWINYAKSDVPLDVFSEDFKVTAEERQIVLDSGTFAVDYTASVGYDRKEPYIDYETYSVEEPYTAWDGNRNITKYRTVQKQRQVTKYRDVTDWNVTSGSFNIESDVAGDNSEKIFANKNKIHNYYSFIARRNIDFLDNISSMKKESVSMLSEKEADSLKITEYAEKVIKDHHDASISSSLSFKIPGDHVKDVRHTIKDVSDHKMSMYIAPEYVAEITYKDQIFAYQTFPFGNTKIPNNSYIKNEESIDKFKEKKEAERKARMTERQASVNKTIWERTKLWSFISIGAMGLSCIISLVVPVAILILLVFAAAMAVFVYTNLQVKKITSEENDKAEKDVMEINEQIQAEIENYEINRKAKLKECLDNKLKALGLKPVSPDEL